VEQRSKKGELHAHKEIGILRLYRGFHPHFWLYTDLFMRGNNPGLGKEPGVRIFGTQGAENPSCSHQLERREAS
jgi:hypothetical protein